MQMLCAGPGKGTGLQSNQLRTNSSSVTLPQAPFTVTQEVPRNRSQRGLIRMTLRKSQPTECRTQDSSITVLSLPPPPTRVTDSPSGVSLRDSQPWSVTRLFFTA